MNVYEIDDGDDGDDVHWNASMVRMDNERKTPTV